MKTDALRSGTTRMQTGLALFAASGIALIAVLLVSGQTRLDVTVIEEMSLAVQIHAASASIALVLGAVQLVLPKGRALHIILGSIWVLAMLGVAISSLFIKQIFVGSFSPIHLFVPLTAFGLFSGLKPLFTGERRTHGKHMRGVYFGALLIAGMFTFLPGRMMWQLFLGG